MWNATWLTNRVERLISLLTNSGECGGSLEPFWLFDYERWPVLNHNGPLDLEEDLFSVHHEQEQPFDNENGKGP